jgi:ABC-type sugar transport system permease subunit/ABC-type glycerol-3-phosphate transport system substrate-binding protein
MGVLEDLEPWIAGDPTFDTSKFIPGVFECWGTWLPGKKKHVYCGIPLYWGCTVIGYDKKIFDEWGVPYLSEYPTPDEILEKARQMHGINPKTGEMNYGLFLPGKYNVWVTHNIMEGFNGGWGQIGKSGAFQYTWDSQENLKALVWLLGASQYIPKSFLTGEEGALLWETARNNIAIRFSRFTNGMYELAYKNGVFMEDGQLRFRFVHQFKNKKGIGGLFGGSPLAMAKSSSLKKEAWRFMKWMSLDRFAQEWITEQYFKSSVLNESRQWNIHTGIKDFRIHMDDIGTCAKRYPWVGSPPRFIVQAEVEQALISANKADYDPVQIEAIAKKCLASIQKQTEAWLATESKIPAAALKPFSMWRFGFPFFVIFLLIIVTVLVVYRRNVRQYWVWYAFLLPGITAFSLFLIYPVFESFRLSFYKSNGFMEIFAGLDNFKDVLSSPIFGKSLYNTFYIGLLHLALGIPIGFILASMINSQKKAQAAFRILYFLPMVTSIIAASIIFKYLFDPDVGIINFYLQKLGINTSSLLWLNDPATSKFVIVFFALWHGVGYTVLICLSGLQAIPDQLYEAATIDGCGPIQKWWYITLPNMRPTFVFLIMTGCIGALKRFQDVYTLGGAAGSPARSIQTVVAYIFEQAFGTYRFGMASAAAYVLFFIILGLTLVNYRVMLHKEKA